MSLTAITRARASALLAGGAALSFIRLPGRAQSNATIRIATIPLENAAEVYYAKDMAFFAKAGLDADIQTMQSSGPIAPAVTSNAIDIGYGVIDTLATLHQKNIPIAVIAPASEYLFPVTSRIAGLVLPANSPVQQANDLNGKIIGIAGLQTLSEDGPRVWLDKNGGDSSTVKFVEVPYPAMPAALAAGRFDAAWVVEPFIGAAKKNGRVLAYGFDSISKDFLISGWYTTPQWANEHPDLVKRFAAAMHDTAVWANKNPTKSGEILAKYTKIDPGAIATMARIHYAEQMRPALMQPLIDVSAKYNGFTTFPAQELIYTPMR